MKQHYSFLIILLFCHLSIYGQLIPNGTIDSIDELSKKDTIYIPMSDGTLLATSISIPVFQDSIITEFSIGGATYPIQIIPKNTQYIIYDSVNITPQSYQLPFVFTRTPYGRSGDDLGSSLFPFIGYAYAIQDMRGRYESEGVYFPMYSDSWAKEPYHPSISIPMDVTNITDPNHTLKHQDGSESIKYIANHLYRYEDVNMDGIIDSIPYSNGNIGMFGASALGNSQYQALSNIPFTENNPLKCIMPIVATNEHYNTTLFHNGVYRNSLATGWIKGQMLDVDNSLNSSDGSVLNNIHSPSDYGYLDNLELANDLIDWYVSDHLGTSPSGSHPTSALRADLDASLAPIDANGFSNANGNNSRYKNLNQPAYHLTGWWDIFINGQIETYNKTKKENPNLRQKLVIGPWTHQTIGTTEVGDMTYPDNVNSILNIDFNFDPADILNDPNIINNLYTSKVLSWFRTHLGGEPYFIIPESNQWQSLGVDQIRIPSENYIIPYYEFLNYLAGESQLAGIPVELDNNGTIIPFPFDLPIIDSALINLSAPLTPPDMNYFDQVKDIRMYITGPTNDANNINVGNYWLSADSLPFKRGITEDYFYFHQNQTIDGNAPTGQEGTLSYIADPNNPISTIGGNNMIPEVPGGGQNSQGSMNLANPSYNSLTMDRPDVLSFVSAPLTDTMTYVGFPKAGIYAKGNTTTHNTTKTDFDIMVRILDVYPDGREMLITEGVVNAKSREYAKSIAQNDTNETTILTNIDNDTYYFFEFDLLPLGHTFGKNHKLKFLLSSSNYPKYQSNAHLPNEDGEFFRWDLGSTDLYTYQGQDLAPQNAEITYDFNDSQPSYIMLPQLDTSYFADVSQEIKTSSALNIYPNPANSFLDVIWNTPINGQINIHNLTGKIVIKKSITQNQKQDLIDVQNLLPGIYLVRIPELNLTKKLMIK
ncbi:CocE/NonD family hydrolase [Brumimicrobium mesophilum]|uniref:CocE/NonD family hydrolase n=1 Tax=Brumimicrobium mesophilum TaxID=392717 RepID=UPI000D144E20|nr:CocE/NonD family hydrolase [Brumimicrobium mesophilum]